MGLRMKQLAMARRRRNWPSRPRRAADRWSTGEPPNLAEHQGKQPPKPLWQRCRKPPPDAANSSEVWKLANKVRTEKGPL